MPHDQNRMRDLKPGMTWVFDMVFTMESTRFRPKPDSFGYYKIFRQMRLNPNRCIMAEDSLENLEIAKKLGMKTVWAGKSHGRPAYVDVNVKSVMQLPGMLCHPGGL